MLSRRSFRHRIKIFAHSEVIWDLSLSPMLEDRGLFLKGSRQRIDDTASFSTP